MPTVTRLPQNRPPVHPGEVLREEFLRPLGMTQTELARRIGVSYPRVNEIVNEKRGITLPRSGWRGRRRGRVAFAAHAARST